MDEYNFGDGECRFCLTVVKSPCPARCVCGVVRCTKCSTFLKGNNPSFCYGCGEIKPAVEANFTRVSSTGVVYMEKEWQKRNLGRFRDKDTLFYISTGYVYKNPDGSIDMTRTGSALGKEVNGTHEQVRHLTEEEVAKFREPSE